MSDNQPQLLMNKRQLLVLGLISLATPLAASPRAFHLALQKSEPADKAALAQAPADLKLWFTENVEVPLTKVTLTRGKDTLSLATLTQAREPKAPIVAKITGSVSPGTYKVDWRAVGKDGHAVKGTFGFTLQAATTPPAGR